MTDLFLKQFVLSELLSVAVSVRFLLEASFLLRQELKREGDWSRDVSRICT